jgi:predicted acylesterase/phospholipase RssA
MESIPSKIELNGSEKFQCLVIGGGGNKGIIVLGVLQYYYEKGFLSLEHIETYVGTSVGAAINLLLVSGYTPMEIFFQIKQENSAFNLEDLNDVSTIMKKMGLMSIKKFVNRISENIEKKLGFIPTLLELHNLSKKNFVVCVCNVTKMQQEYYSHENKPNLSCIDAVKMSCNIPVIFQALQYNEEYVVDGGLMNNFPLEYVDDGEKRILGIVIISTDYSLPEDTFLGYFYRLMIMPSISNTLLRCEMAKENTTLIKVKWSKTTFFINDLDNETKMDMFLHGYKTAEIVDKSQKIFVDGWV